LQARALLKALRGLEAVRGPVDVVHSHFYSGALPIALMSRMAGIPFVHTEHSSAFCRAQTLRGRTLSGAGARTARFVFGAAAAVLTVSPYLAREMESTLGVRSDRVIPNPIDVDLFQCHALPSTSDGVRLLHVGRLAEDKGVIGILDAFAKARRADPRLRLTFVGQGPLLQTLRARAEQSGVGPFVEFLGARPRHELPGIFAANHLVVSNAMVETFCVAAAEAMSVGRLVVAPARAALPETLGGAGLLFEPDTGNLRDAILAGVQSLTSWVPEKAHLSVVERFGPAVVAAALSSVYDEVAAHSSRRD
jgi:glycosyltransferase involved in cell wall biosynthesis